MSFYVNSPAFYRFKSNETSKSILVQSPFTLLVSFDDWLKFLGIIHFKKESHANHQFFDRACVFLLFLLSEVQKNVLL